MNEKTRYVKLFAALVAVAVLTLASLGTALAAPQSGAANKQGIFGAVSAKSDSSLTIDAKDGTQTVLVVTPETKFLVPSVDSPTLADVEIGSRVAALASVQGDTRTALRVMVIPSQPTIEHITITVMEVQGNTVVGEDEDGNTLSIELPRPPSQDLVGQLLTVVVKAARPGTQTTLKAQASVSMRDVVGRLKDQAAKAKANQAAGQQLDQLVQRLEDAMQRHLDRFSLIIARAPERAQPALKDALDNYRKGYESALDTLGKVDARVKERLNTAHASGTVASVDVAAGKLGIDLPNGAQLSLTTDASTKVSIGDQEATLADVSVGDSVDVAYKLREMLATRIAVRIEASVRGSVQSVDASNNLTLTLADGTSLTLAITTDTTIEVDGKPGAVTDLKAGLVVSVKYNLRSRQAISIKAGTEVVAEGTLKSISATDHTITITTDSGTDATFTVSTSTRISARGLVLTLLGLKEGAKVRVVYEASSMQAKSITVWTEVEQQQRQNRGVVAGLITAVDTAQNFLSIQAANGAAITLIIGAQTSIHLNGRDATLGDLKDGMQVVASYEIDTKTAIDIKAASRPAITAHLTVRGSIVAVDTAASTVAIKVGALPIVGGLSVTVKVTANTKVTLDGKQATLSDLAAGQGVLAQYSALSKEAVKLEASSKITGPQQRGGQGAPRNNAGSAGSETVNQNVPLPARAIPAPRQPLPTLNRLGAAQ